MTMKSSEMHVLQHTMCLLIFISFHVAYGAVKTDFDQLYDTLFTNYSTNALPLLNHSDTVTVAITASAININKFDEISGELSLTMVFTFAWHEKRVSWNVSENNFIASLPVQPEHIWKPQVYLLQSTDSVDDIAASTVQARLHHDGKIVWNAGKVIKVACSVDVRYFPFDTQVCETTLLNWVLTNSELKLLPGKTGIQNPHFSHNSQWELRPSSLLSCRQREFQKLPCLSLKFVLKRRSSFFVSYIIIPLILLGLTNNVVFVMPPSSGERTSVSITVFLSFIVYMDIVNDMIPQSSEPMAYIYTYILYLLVYSCISVLLCVISLRIYNKTTRVPRPIETLIWYTRFRFVSARAQRKGDVRITDFDVPPTSDTDGAMSMGDLVNVVSCTKTSATTNITGKGVINQSQLHDKETIGVEYVTDWEIVGKTFDFYCCFFLYIIFIIFSFFTFVNLLENKGLRR